MNQTFSEAVSCSPCSSASANAGHCDHRHGLGVPGRDMTVALGEEKEGRGEGQEGEAVTVWDGPLVKELLLLERGGVISGAFCAL